VSDAVKPAAPQPAYTVFYEELARSLEENGQATPVEARRIQAALDQLDSHAPVSQATVAELLDSRLAPQFTFETDIEALAKELFPRPLPPPAPPPAAKEPAGPGPIKTEVLGWLKRAVAFARDRL
jgi:hypothetical protein